MIIIWIQKKKYYYRCEEPPISSLCNKRICKNKKFGVGGGEEEIPYELGTLIKIDTDPPTWFIDVDGHRLELSTEDLMSQERFRRKCVDTINKLPRTIKKYIKQ